MSDQFKTIAASPDAGVREQTIEECAKIAESFRRQVLPGDRAIIRKIEDAIRALAAHPPAQEAGEIEVHVGWLKFYIERMDATNWKDMRLRAERQLESLATALSRPQRGEVG